MTSVPLCPPPSRAPCGTICLANATLVLPDRVVRGALTIADGTIKDITEGAQVPPGATECSGDIVLPGLVELHTDNLERHIEPRPTVNWPHLPALIAHDCELAACGITTVFDALRVGSLRDSPARYDPYARALANDLLQANADHMFKISHFLHLRAEICSENLLDELADFGAEDRVGIVSLMDHTPGQRQFRDLGTLRAYLGKRRGLSEDEFATHVARRKALQARLGAAHERGAVAAAQRFGAVLASHDDTTPAQVAVSHRNGVRFAEFPTTRAAAEACHDAGIAVMMGAPNIIRGGSHSGNVSAMDLARAGVLDIISSDYVPSALLLSAFALAEIWDDLPRAIACVTRTPAMVAGLGDRGALEPGLRGDVVRVAMHGSLPLLRGVWSRGVRIS